MRSALAVAAIVALTGGARAAECPSDAYALELKEGEALTCTCAAPVDDVLSIYGTDRYTADSNLCLAAVHAGKIMVAAGGEVTIYIGGACDVFVSTERNGVLSSEWSAYDKTFAFATPLPACGTAEAIVETPASYQPPPLPPGPAPKAGPKEWQARADRFAAALPAPLDGWGTTTARGEYANDSVNGRHVMGIVWFKKNGNTTDSDVLMGIMNAPDAGPYAHAEWLWTDEKYRAEYKGTKTTFAGREAVVIDSADGQQVWFRTASGLFVQLSRLKSHAIVTAADLEAYAAVIDFAAIEKLPIE